MLGRLLSTSQCRWMTIMRQLEPASGIHELPFGSGADHVYARVTKGTFIRSRASEIDVAAS